MAWAPFVQRAAAAAAVAAASTGSTPAEYPWVQLAGHQGNFVSGANGRVLKRLCQSEADCLLALTNDPLGQFVPKYYGIIKSDDGSQYVEMQDLLHGLHRPSLMDCKIGCRTYLESELGKDSPRPDLYEKMTAVDPEEPSESERAAGAITKSRYMEWRERLSSTSQLAFRIDGVQKVSAEDGRAVTPPCDFKTLQREEDIVEVFRFFTDGDAGVIDAYCRRLEQIRAAMLQSEFFKTHELIGSSLLFAHDAKGFASVWLIDFGKTHTSPVPITHRREWHLGNHEDGYCTGFDNIQRLLPAAARR